MMEFFGCTITISVVIVLVSVVQVHSTTNIIRLYEANNFTKLLYEAPLNTASCVNLPTYAQAAAASISTDLCVLIYKSIGCQGYSARVDGKQNGGGKYNLYTIRHTTTEHFERNVQSYMQCNPNEGGDTINVDFYTIPPIVLPPFFLPSKLSASPNTITYSYKDIRDCMDLPVINRNFQYLHKINNHGNCVKLYTAVNCKGSSIEIKGGKSTRSENVRALSTSLYSVSPCGNYLEKSITLSATVTKFSLMANKKREVAETKKLNVALSAKTIFRNNGSATVTQEYSATKTITESYETTRQVSSSSMHSVSVAATVESEFGGGIPLIASTKVTASLSTAYTYTRTTTNTAESKYSSTESIEYSVLQKLEIPKCTLYEVSSYVQLMEKYPVDYTVTYEVQGVARDGRNLSAAEIKPRLGGFEFVRNINSFTVEAKSYGTMVSSFGVDSVIDGAGQTIPNC